MTNYSRIYLVLITALILRSFIAPGYMISVGTDEAPGLSIVFCYGPTGIGTYQTNNDHNHGEHHHHNDHDSKSQNHITPTCSFWSTSSVLIVSTDLLLQDSVIYRDFIPKEYVTSFHIQNLIRNQLIRGPPLLSLNNSNVT